MRTWRGLVAVALAAGCMLASRAAAQSSAAPAAPSAARTAGASAQPPTVRQVSPYADLRARSVGDLVNIVIRERASASNTSTLSTTRRTSFNNSSEGGAGALSFLPDFGFSADLGRSHEGRGESRQEGRLTAQVAASVVAVRPNGDLELAGERQVTVNDEVETILLTGVVRPVDIEPGNVVDSSNIAEAKITYKGKGRVSKGSRPNVIARLLSWLF